MHKLINTDTTKCVGCNKCIMVCPVNFANKVVIIDGERKVEACANHCIKCGACLQVCDHGARSYIEDFDRFMQDLEKGEKISLVVAPSYVANQYDKYKHIFSFLKSKGVNLIYDVSFGADITSWAYIKYLENNPEKDFVISQPCPAVVNFIEKYTPNLLENLIPIQSPVLCTAIYLKKVKKITDKIAFLSPCIAKKNEFLNSPEDLVEYNITFEKLCLYFQKNQIDIFEYPEVDFDNPGAGLGVMYSKPGGLKENLEYHLPDLKICQIEGSDKAYEYLRFLSGGGRLGGYDFVDILNCEYGCNVGSAACNENCYLGLSRNFEQEILNDSRLKNQEKREFNKEEYEKSLKYFDANLSLDDFAVEYEDKSSNIKLHNVSDEDIEKAFQVLGKNDEASRKINCYSCGYKTCKEMAIAIANGYNTPSSCYQYNKKQLENQKTILAENEKYIRSIIEHLAESVIVTDKNGIIEFVNKKTEDVFGYSLNEYPKNHINKFVNNLNCDQLTQDFDYDFMVKNKDEQDIWIKLKYNSIEINNEIIYIFIIADISREKELDGLKNEFVSMISHELRTPLTSIRGALGLISSGVLGKLPDKAQNLLDIAGNNAIRLVNLINDILDLEKIKAGKMDFNFDEYEVMPLIEEAVAFNEEYAKQYNVRYEIKQRLDNVFINVDKDRLIQVITNLLSNAAKFSLSNEVVSVYVGRKQNLVTISVENKGAGIPPESYSKIFKSFSQVDSTDTRGKGGTGLGLSICQTIVEKMAGNIGFTSKVNETTTFYVELPEILCKNDKKRVLICEDNHLTAICIEKMFKKLDYKADIALNAKEVMHCLSNREYDLMTLDIVLPDKNGLDLLDEIRNNENTEKMPVIIITASEKESIQKNLKYDTISFLEKSFDVEALKESIGKIFESKNKNKVNILHIEDNDDVLTIISEALKSVANVENINNLQGAIKLLQDKVFDIIILDYKFPDGTCEELLDIIDNTQNKEAHLVVFSAYEISQSLSDRVDAIILKSKVSNEQFLKSIQVFIDNKKKNFAIKEKTK